MAIESERQLKATQIYVHCRLNPLKEIWIDFKVKVSYYLICYNNPYVTALLLVVPCQK